MRVHDNQLKIKVDVQCKIMKVIHLNCRVEHEVDMIITFFNTI